MDLEKGEGRPRSSGVAEKGGMSAGLQSWAVAGAGALSAAGCGGGGGDPPDPLPTPAIEPLAAEFAARFLMQAGLGATVDDVLLLQRAGVPGLREWLDLQMALPLTTPTVFAWAREKGFDAPVFYGTDAGVDNALWARLLGARDVLRQRLALAWSQLFVVSASNMGTPWGQFAAMAYWDVLEADALGNFRTLLENVTLSPAMGVFLNMRGSRKADGGGRQPDENYAREILQLFTIGLVELQADGTPRLGSDGLPIPIYGNDDVSGLARAFTGWDFDNGSDATPDHLARPMVPDDAHHSPEEKRFLGTVIPAGTGARASLKQALDAIFNHPNVPPFIAAHLIRQMVTSNPSPQYVARVAAAFMDNGLGVRGDLKAVVRAVVLDPEARPDPQALGSGALSHGKLREPVLRLVHWARLFRVRSTDGLWAVPNLATSTALAQSPLRAPSVFNFYRPGYVPPHTPMAQQGLVAPEFQLTDEATVIAYVNFMQRIVGFGAANVVPRYDAPPGDANDWLSRAADPAALVSWLGVLLTGGCLLADTAEQIRQAVASVSLDGTHPVATPDQGFQPANGRLARVALAVFMVLCSPDFLVQR